MIAQAQREKEIGEGRKRDPYVDRITNSPELYEFLAKRLEIAKKERMKDIKE